MLSQAQIEKYLANQLSEAELRAFLEEAQRTDPADLPETLLKQLWTDSDRYSVSAETSTRLSASLRQRLSQSDSSQISSSRPRPLWYRAAAVVSVLVAAAALWFWIGPGALTEHTTRYGEISKVTLPDGSTVTLNANSSLRYAEPWNPQQPREVWLDGEAYFSVIHTKNDQRFHVHLTDDFRVEVLGTEFNVKDRHHRAQVVLHSGRVRLTINDPDQPQNVSMQPGELVEYSEVDQVLTQQPVDPTPYAAWRQGQMVFERTPLREIADALEDHYGVRVVIADDDLASTQLTGAFPVRNLDMILELLPTIADVKVIRDDREIILQPQKTIDP